MKNLFFALAFMLVGTFTFASSEAIDSNINLITIESISDEKEDNKKIDEWVCCTVNRNGGSATVCRADGDVTAACNQAIKYTQKQ
jgi:hypothetical protein